MARALPGAEEAEPVLETSFTRIRIMALRLDRAFGGATMI